MEINEIKCSVCPHTSGYDSAIDDCERIVNDYFDKLFDVFAEDKYQDIRSDLIAQMESIRKEKADE